MPFVVGSRALRYLVAPYDFGAEGCCTFNYPLLSALYHLHCEINTGNDEWRPRHFAVGGTSSRILGLSRSCPLRREVLISRETSLAPAWGCSRAGCGDSGVPQPGCIYIAGGHRLHPILSSFLPQTRQMAAQEYYRDDPASRPLSPLTNTSDNVFFFFFFF